MNSLLKRVLFFNQTKNYLHFWPSFFCLVISYAFAFYINHYQNELNAEFLIYKKDYISSKKLQKAKRILNANPLNPHEFIKTELENTPLLTHIKHHHENSCITSTPVAFNPTGNHLSHTPADISTKGLKRLQFSLSSPVLMDEEDLKHLFSLTEEKAIFPFQVPTHAPFLFFTKFHIKKHSLSLYENVFEIDYKLESLSL